MAEEELVEVTDRSFEKVVERGEKPAIVMFYSPGCPFCRSIEPYFRQYAKEFAGEVTFARIDISNNIWTAERFGVRGTPTFKFFCSGRPVADMVGAVYPTLLRRMIEEGLKNGEDCVKSSTAINYDISGYA
ncbi:thioredoxin-like negative regulator of GroEL [Methanolinea mesophila]|uniref:thioredoxin family protein n=1 Tax=Methanolinea mesophila TaxID=547055 RepID=UPI001AEA1277|nr:thioredoxin family protein [Methanolinea mesophila]MBP1928213.1 thioredoxin-like negative regulator of GroEL [Methanolinea mesophila]